MKCIICGSEFEAKRSSAKYCSGKCRKLAFQRVSVLSVPSVSVPDNGTDKDERHCKVKGCYLITMPGHRGLCIYHWRGEEDLNQIPKDQYEELNTKAKDSVLALV